LVECKRCSFIFFNPRLEPDEEQRLYTHYRNEEYQRIRQSCEPWYTPNFNAKLSNPQSLAVRREKLAPILRTHVAGIEKPRILDFGGDRGQLIQDLIPNAAGYTYDISNVEPLKGIEHCRDLSECRARTFDLIICSNVLEHVGFPRAIVDEIKQIASPETQVFIEVPFESPFGSTLVVRRLAQFALLAITRPSVALTLARPGLLYVMHEHINYYNKNSLEALMSASGLTVTVSDAYHISGPMGTGTMGWSLGKLAVDP
jgi:2-polyprenyl-3-methyl-5-hydroxy-6-metoxy-1,4-benzoquinol methylase